MPNEQMSDVERLLVAQAMYTKLGDVVATKGKTLRTDVADAYRDLWEKTGAKSFAMRMNGEKVATYSVSETQDKVETVFDCDDWTAFEEWCNSEEGFDTLMDFAMEDTQRFIKFAIDANDGAIPAGVTPRHDKVKGGKYKNGRITQLKADRILEMARDGMELPPAMAKLLTE